MKGVVSRYTDDLSGLPEVPTPVDIKLVPPDTSLLITGPNTGGKTVALKTAGLLPLMAQAGLHVPAEAGSAVPVFRSIFADIGDEQSIAASLSTFGWHITNIASMDRDLALPALVLLDEIGAGTDPDRRRRAGRCHRRSLPHARRARHRHDALRRAEDLRVDHARRRVGRVCVRSRRLRADVSPDLRVARPQSGARNGEPSGAEPADRRSGASGARHARTTAGDAARTHGPRPRAARRGPESRGRRARRAVAGEGAGRTSGKRSCTSARRRSGAS